MRLRRTLALAVAAVSTVLLVPTVASVAPAAAAEDGPGEYQEYVALGDSFASLGSLTRLQADPDTGCLRSTDNYPEKLAVELQPGALIDATCAGAKTDGVLDSQLDALSPDTDLVTVTIGGNDIGFVDIITTCGLLSLTNPLGNPCESRYTEGGNDEIAEVIADTAPKIDAVLEGVAERAPNAEVVVVGYLQILPEQLGCWPLMPVSVGDVSYLNGVQGQLNDMIGARANAGGATFVDPSSPGHDACQLPWNRWVDGLLPLANGTPVHPTAAGQEHVAGLVRDAV